MSPSIQIEMDSSRSLGFFMDTICITVRPLVLNVFTTPLRQWGFWQCLPFSWTTLRGKHCQHPITVMGVVDTFELGQAIYKNFYIPHFLKKTSGFCSFSLPFEICVMNVL